MIETNLRIVSPGSPLYVWTRKATLSGPNLTADLAEKACGVLRRKHSLAAVPYPGTPGTLLVATQLPIVPTHLEGGEWELDIKDAGEPAQRLTLTSPHNGAELLCTVIERAFLVQIAARTDFWTLDSQRIFYEAKPFRIEHGIAAYCRYEIGSMLVEGVGVGLVVDVGTAFFSEQPLAYFFDPKIPPEERRKRESAFQRLSLRQAGQKGTLMYDNGRTRVKCYFVEAPIGMTCANTGAVRVKQQSYESLLDYYQEEYPDLPVQASTPAVRVSFTGLEFPQPIAADRVRIRVMNDNVPESLSDVDKIPPDERQRILTQFWSRFEPKPLGNVAPGLQSGFWRPDQHHTIQCTIPPLLFGSKQILEPPRTFSNSSYRENFQQRLKYLKQYGCYHVPPNMTRTLYCVYPNQLNKQSANQLATDLAKNLSELTGKDMTAQLVEYDTIGDAIEKLRDANEAGMALFVLNNEPAAYYEAAFQLSTWRVKRVTTETLDQHYRYLTKGAWDRHIRSDTLEMGQKRWSGFINLIALDVAQLLDVVPYRIECAGPYDAQVVIDVGYEWRHFALSMLIARQSTKIPDFRIVSHVYRKADRQQESINQRILADSMLDLAGQCFPRRFDPLESLLIMRDGRIIDQEIKGLDSAVEQMKAKGYLSTDARVDLIEIHKDTLKSIRIWEATANNSVENPLLGTGVMLNSQMIAIATTGNPTLTQGTAGPILIVSHDRCLSVLDAARANFAGAQLNWSSPSVAQRLHIGVKRTDEDLEARDAQEIRRLR